MYKVLSKDMIEFATLPYLSTAKRGYKTQSSLVEIVNSILYKLKTGVQWYLLPVASLFSNKVLYYKTVFGHYRKQNQEHLLDEALYQQRYVTEWTNVWKDSFGSVLNRLDTTGSS